MIVRVARSESDPVSVGDPMLLNALEVRLDDVGPSDVDAILRAAGLGTADQEHAWLDIEALRELCGIEDDRWHSDFDAMIRYARDHGWTSEDGRWVRAHLSR